MSTTEVNETLVYLSPSVLVAHPENVRRKVVTTGKDWANFVQSVQKMGVVQPIVVRPVNGYEPDSETPLPVQFQIIAGHRRVEAARATDLTSVPAIVRHDLSDEDALILMLVENVQREDIDPVDEAAGLFRLISLGMTQKDLAASVGRSLTHVRSRLKLLEAPAWVLALLRQDKISLLDALDYAMESDETVRDNARVLIHERGFTPGHALQRAKDDLEREQKWAAEAAKQQKKGFDTKPLEYAGRLPKGFVDLESLGLSPQDAKKAGLPVTAFITPYGHVTLGTDAKKEAKALVTDALTDEQRAAIESEREAKREAKVRQQQEFELLSTWAKGKASTTALNDTAVDVLISVVGQDLARRACALLGVEAEDQQGFPYWPAALAKCPRREVIRGLYAALAYDRGGWGEWLDRKAAIIAETTSEPEPPADS